MCLEAGFKRTQFVSDGATGKRQMVRAPWAWGLDNAAAAQRVMIGANNMRIPRAV